MKEKATWKTVLQIAWPLIIANSFWNLQLTIDRIFLGSLSTEAIGAAVSVLGVFWVPMALLQQTSSYITTFVAQYLGAGEDNKIGLAFWQALYVSVIGGLLFMVQNYFSAPFFAMVGHSPQFQELEVAYFNSVAYSALPTALVAVISGFYTGLGNTKTIIGINVVGLVLNVIFDYAMIFGHWGFPAMGVEGAGYATAIATYGSAIYGLWLMFGSKEHARFNLTSSWRFNFGLVKQFLRFGLPAGLQWALEGLAFTVFLIIMGRFANGEAALASSSIAVTIMMLSVLPSMGIAQAVMTLVGQRLGDKKPSEAERITWIGVRLSVIYMGTVGLTFALMPDFYLSWFKNDSSPELWAQVSAIVPRILMMVAFFAIFDSIYFNVSFALKGAGDTRFVSLVALVLPWPFMVLPAYMVRDWDHAVIWAWAFGLLYSSVITSVLIWRFKGGRWKTMSVIHPAP